MLKICLFVLPSVPMSCLLTVHLWTTARSMDCKATSSTSTCTAVGSSPCAVHSGISSPGKVRLGDLSSWSWRAVEEKLLIQTLFFLPRIILHVVAHLESVSPSLFPGRCLCIGLMRHHSQPVCLACLFCSHPLSSGRRLGSSFLMIVPDCYSYFQIFPLLPRTVVNVVTG